LRTSGLRLAPGESGPALPDFDPDVYWNNRGGKHYDESIAVPDYEVYLKYQRKWLSGLVGKAKPKNLLDFGCGTGAMFACWEGVEKVTAFDRSYTMLHQSRVLNRRKGYEYEFRGPESDNRARTPFNDNSFDFVAMATVLAHLRPDDFLAFHSELRRISRPGATWAIITAATCDDSESAYMWDHDYGELLDIGVKVLDDHNFGPYRLIEAVYEGQRVSTSKGRISPIPGDCTLRNPEGGSEEQKVVSMAKVIKTWSGIK